MANSYKLSLTYTDSEGKDKTLSYASISSDVTATQVKNLASALVTNGSIFKVPPVKIKSAKTVEVTENAIDLS